MFKFNKEQFPALVKALDLIDADSYGLAATSSRIHDGWRVYEFSEVDLRKCDNILKLVDHTPLREMIAPRKRRRAQTLLKKYGSNLEQSAFEYIVFPLSGNDDDEVVNAVFDHLCVNAKDGALLFHVFESYFNGDLFGEQCK